jgi:hypothetical protein
MHTPAPQGLPGGYPVRVSCCGVDIAPIIGLGLHEAIDINERSHRFDGIECIKTDGTVVFTPDAAKAMKEVFRFDCKQLHPEESAERAAELGTRMQEHICISTP